MQSQEWHNTLGKREIEVLALLADGLSNARIAQKLFLSIETVKWYNKQIFSKLGVSNRTQAANQARAHRILSSNPVSKTPKDHKVKTNLPAQLTTFIGREKEISDLINLLQSARLVVLTGPGGSGKTRLAIEVGRAVIQNYQDGVWLADLSTITEPADVLNTIASVQKIAVSSKTPVAELIKRYLRRKQILLIIDNFEHVLVEAPALTEILAAAPETTMLVTSRERLNVSGEREYAVPPLSLPDRDGTEGPEKLKKIESIQLFLDRVRAVKPGISISPADLASIAQICTRLDGLPLAIELAAPQIKVFPLATIEQRLLSDLDVLPEGPRDFPSRQRTLRATLEWSLNLLSEPLRRLFYRLAVFNGGGTLKAIEKVCGNDLAGDVSSLLTALVEKNLVAPVEKPDGELYFKLLETVRQFCLERLNTLNEGPEFFRLHAEYFVALAEKAADEIRGAIHAYWFKRLRSEQDNFRSALTWSFDHDELDFGLRLSGALSYYWYYNGLAAEGRKWTDLALQRASGAAPELRAGVLLTAGNLCYALNDLQKSAEFLKEAHKIYDQIGDERKATRSLLYLGLTSFESAEEISENIILVHQCKIKFRQLGDKAGEAESLNFLGELARLAGDYGAAKNYYEECLEMVQRTGETIRVAIQYENLGIVATHDKDYDLARDYIKKGLSLFLEMGAPFGLATILASLAGPTAALGFPKLAARLLGASNAMLETLGTDQQPADQFEVKLFIETIRGQLGEEEFSRAWAEGQKMTIQQAVEYALQDPVLETE